MKSGPNTTTFAYVQHNATLQLEAGHSIECITEVEGNCLSIEPWCLGLRVYCHGLQITASASGFKKPGVFFKKPNPPGFIGLV